MKANKIDLAKLEKALRSDVFDNNGESYKFKMQFIVYAFHKNYGENYQGAFSAEIKDYDTALKIFKSLKKDKNFEELQLRVYGYYGTVPSEGKYEILEISRPDGSSFRLDVYDAA